MSWTNLPDGRVLCSHGKTFDPSKESCADCDNEDAITPSEALGDAELLVETARSLGIPDSLAVEKRAWDQYIQALTVVDTLVSNAETAPVDEALRWYTVAKGWADVATKINRGLGASITTREREALRERRDRMIKELVEK